MEDISLRVLGTGQFGSGTPKVAYRLSNHLKDTHLGSAQSVTHPTEPESCLDRKTGLFVFGILPMATYFPHWGVMNTLSPLLLALMMAHLFSLETIGEISLSGMLKVKI